MTIEIPKSWKNVATKVRGVQAGERISVQVEGGYVGKPAPCAGLVATYGEGNEALDIFLPNERIPDTWFDDDDGGDPRGT